MTSFLLELHQRAFQFVSRLIRDQFNVETSLFPDHARDTQRRQDNRRIRVELRHLRRYVRGVGEIGCDEQFDARRFRCIALRWIVDPRFCRCVLQNQHGPVCRFEQPAVNRAITFLERT